MILFAVKRQLNRTFEFDKKRVLLRPMLMLLASFFTVISISATPGTALALEDDEDTIARAPQSEVDKARRRLYAGGRDEEELTVQATLPQPVRSPDAVPNSGGSDTGSRD